MRETGRVRKTERETVTVRERVRQTRETGRVRKTERETVRMRETVRERW